ncbi:MAG: major facilitator superfamily 1 [Acidobacteria bacterium]|nr:major facilitator superfamily 1 [Acidobacteriota bacterium]
MPRPLTRHDYRTLALAALGGALEFYDFVIYVFLAPVIGRLFFPADMPDWLRLLQTFGIFSAGYLARPLGGIVIAHFGDLLGRKRMFTLSIFLMAAPTLAIGLLPTYASVGIVAPLLLLLMRILQGVAIGGEVPGAWVFVAEHVPEQRFGLGIGTLTAGLTTGILLGSLMAGAIDTVYGPAAVAAFAWRIPFVAGGAFGFVSVYLRRFLAETPVFQEMQTRRSLAREVPIKTVLRDHRRETLLALGLTWVLTAGIVVVILFTPAYLQQVFHVPAVSALRANTFATMTFIAGCLVFGWASDRIGTRTAMVSGFTGLLASSYLFYSGLPGAPIWLNLTYALTGFFVGAVTLVPIAAVRSFPAPVRFSGLSFAYNVSYAVFGGLTPVVLSLWVRTDPMAPAYYVGGLCLLGIALAFAPNSATL